MARSRNIKPGFFTNDVLGELPALTRLLFAGMWTICDRAGRVEDRPKKIKAEVLPYDDCDPEAMLQDLEKHGFILRYTAGGISAIQVLAWDKHQNPHVKEAASTIPAPIEHSASTVQSPDKERPLPERAGLIPDSGFLIPDSSPLIPSIEPTALVGSPPASVESAPPAQVVKLTDRRIPCPADQLLEAFHAECPTLPRVIKLNDKRKTHLTARWREVDAESKFSSADDGIEVFRGVFRKVNGSDFLTGRAKQNGRSWSASFDWLFESSTNFLKVCEGQYDNEPPRQRNRSEWTIGAI